MSTLLPELTDDHNLSEAWARLFLKCMSEPSHSIPPVLLSLHCGADGMPSENASIRTDLDESLIYHGGCTSKITANTIFPHDHWIRNHHASRGDLYKWYLEKMFPRLKARDRRNCYGTYFERMINSSGAVNSRGRLTVKSTNQLEHIIGLWESGIGKGRRPRRSALQISCFDPSKDHTGQVVRGFPCLQQVSFSYDNTDGISVTAIYPIQYIFDRAYGNYLGLCNLGNFVANEIGVRLVRLNCLIIQPELGKSKSVLRPLERRIRNALDD